MHIHPECSPLREQDIRICFPCWHSQHNNKKKNESDHSILETPSQPPLANRSNTVHYETPAFRIGDYVTINNQNSARICGHKYTPGGTAEYSARHAINNCYTPGVRLSRLQPATLEPLSSARSNQYAVGPSLLSRAHSSRRESRSEQEDTRKKEPKESIIQKLLKRTMEWKRNGSKGMHPMEKFLAKKFEKEESYLQVLRAMESNRPALEKNISQ
jgi:hypothetical protein